MSRPANSVTPPVRALIRAPRAHSLFAAVLAFGVAACGDTTSPARQSASVAASATKGGPGASTGTNTLKLTISGLPAGVAAAVSVGGPNGYSKSVTTSTSLSGLANGTYTVTSAPVIVGSATYAASPANQSFNLKNGRTVSGSVTYTVVPTTGTMVVAVSIGESVPVSLTVTGPNGYTRAVTRTDTLRALPPGAYTVAAQPITGATGVNYTPAPTTQSANVQVGATTIASVSYSPTSITSPSGLNLQVVGMYLVQSVQTLNGSVPLVAGRDGVLRVFALANTTNTVTPSVRARFFINGTLVNTITVAAPATSVPTAIDEGSALASWNITVPSSLVQPGLAILADVDPTDAVTESSETDNQFPLGGTPLPMDVRGVPGLAVRFVPVYQSAIGTTGNVSDANTATYLQRLRDIHPVNTIAASVRAPYTTSLTLGSDGTNWSSALSELYTLRALDGSNDQYYGVARVPYGSGVAGIGYIGAPAALGWDASGSAGEVMAHELGHNWGRNHAPCGGVANPDASFPYAGGIIGAFGWNVRTNALQQRTTADLMGYCSPTWISDYNYKAVFAYRASTTAGTITSASVQPGLLVWGKVAGDGTITLEPAVRVTGRSVLPVQDGAFTAEGTDASGGRIFSISFEPTDVSEDVAGDEQHFAFVVPLSDVDHARLQTLRVGAFGRSAVRDSRGPGAALGAAAAASLDAAGGAARLRWSGTDAPLVMVRDVATGEVLSFARGGDVLVHTTSADLDLVFSDGVHSSTRRAHVRGR